MMGFGVDYFKPAYNLKLGLVLLSVFLTHKNKILAHDKIFSFIIISLLFKRENQHKINRENV